MPHSSVFQEELAAERKAKGRLQQALERQRQEAADTADRYEQVRADAASKRHHPLPLLTVVMPTSPPVFK